MKQHNSMKQYGVIGIGLAILIGTLALQTPVAAKTIKLLAPQETEASLLKAVKARRTVRAFNPENSVTLQEVSNILFAMQGLTAENKRAVPSSMGAYPIEIYLVTRNIKGLKDGLYKLNEKKDGLRLVKAGDLNQALSAASSNQKTVLQAQCKVIMTSVWQRLANQGDNYQRWGYLEAGAIGQNGMVMAAALGLNTVPVGGFTPAQVAQVIGVDGKKETPVYINCYGR